MDWSPWAVTLIDCLSIWIWNRFYFQWVRRIWASSLPPQLARNFFFWGISIYERNKIFIRIHNYVFQIRNYILRIITSYLVSVSCLTGICFFWCKDLQSGILDSLSKATRRETLVKIVPKSSSPTLSSSCSHKVWMNQDPSL